MCRVSVRQGRWSVPWGCYQHSRGTQICSNYTLTGGCRGGKSWRIGKFMQTMTPNMPQYDPLEVQRQRNAVQGGRTTNETALITWPTSSISRPRAEVMAAIQRDPSLQALLFGGGVPQSTLGSLGHRWPGPSWRWPPSRSRRPARPAPRGAAGRARWAGPQPLCQRATDRRGTDPAERHGRRSCPPSPHRQAPRRWRRSGRTGAMPGPPQPQNPLLEMARTRPTGGADALRAADARCKPHGSTWVRRLPGGSPALSKA